jgi:integrase
MARETARLNASKAARLREPGMHADGDGLFLSITPSGSRSWILRYRRAGRRRDMGLGSLSAVSLADARKLAQEARRLIVAGVDPIDARRVSTLDGDVTFKAAAERCIADRRDGWRNDKHKAQWTTSLTTYAFPTLGRLSVAAIRPSDVAACLRPIWLTKAETARRVRQRIEAILDWAAVHGYRSRDNPARLKGNLDALLPKRDRQEQAHHAAVAVAAMPAFMKRLRHQPGMAAKAMQLMIWAATRTSETLLARWDEFDLDAAIWTIPGERTKTGQMHRVPLPTKAVEMLRDLHEIRRGAWVFSGNREKPLGSGALLALMRRMGEDATPHGMRSCFRVWAATTTTYPSEIAELALAHRPGSRVERAYQRDDLLERRRPMMQDWADYLVR